MGEYVNNFVIGMYKINSIYILLQFSKGEGEKFNSKSSDTLPSKCPILTIDNGYSFLSQW